MKVFSSRTRVGRARTPVEGACFGRMTVLYARKDGEGFGATVGCEGLEKKGDGGLYEIGGIFCLGRYVVWK